MPGHKGRTVIGPEALDITEISGADVLYGKDPSGIIAESEQNASAIFGTAKTLYSTEGSSLCIRAMLYLLKMYAQSRGRKARIAAGRNAHKTFITGAALLDLDVRWMYSGKPGLAACELSPEKVEAAISETKPDAVYLTSPDYLGNVADIRRIAELCHRYGCLLLVDNAHGAYLKFLPGEEGRSLHPIDLGADLCCDSAHKTLPALTGAAYLHISGNCPEMFRAQAEHAIKMFASTSPSYLILQSLDRTNQLIADGLDKEIRERAVQVQKLKEKLGAAGCVLAGREALKLTVEAASFGRSGEELAQLLKEKGLICEFCDPDYLVLMFSAFNTEQEIEAAGEALLELKLAEASSAQGPPELRPGEAVMSLHDAMLCPGEEIDIREAEGRILASADVACPPAIPIAVCGERISREAIRCFEYYGISRITVVKES